MFLVPKRIFFHFLTLLINLSKCSFAIQIHEKYCGFEQRCGINQTNIAATKGSCCQPCECVDVCKERDTCCADMKGLDETKEIIKQQCLPAEFVPHGLRAPKNPISYYVRSHCPKTFTDIVVAEKCQRQTNDTLEEITFVSSKDGNIIYRNKFCGLCHGDKTTIPWTLLVPRECIHVLGTTEVTLSSVNKTILTNCKVSLIEPKGLQSKHNICFEDELVIGWCNHTGEWDVYNKILEELCLHPPEPVNYYFYQGGGFLVYRSVYCYLCNTKKASSDPLKCELNFRRTTGALSALIKQSALTGSKDRQEQSTICNDDEILDTFFNICRRLYCPKFFLPDFGQCKSFLDTKFSYKLIVKLVFLEPTSKSDFLKLYLTPLSVRVLNQLGFSRCQICFFTILLKRDSNETMLSEVYLDVILAPKGKCEIEYLFSKITALEMSSSNIKKVMLNKTTLSFEAFWSNGSIFYNVQYEQIYMSHYKPCTVRFPAENLSKCAKVKLGIQEYQHVLKNHENENKLLFAPVKEDMNRTMFVCIDKYIIHPHSAGDKVKSSLLMAFATLIITSHKSTCMR